jgi:hypothetical protein
MPIRSLLAILALLSPSCAYPRAALATGTVIGVLGGVALATTHVRDCSSPNASDLCGFDQLHDQINQDIGAVILTTGITLALIGLVGLANEHSRPVVAPAAPAAPRASGAPIGPMAAPTPSSTPDAAQVVPGRGCSGREDGGSSRLASAPFESDYSHYGASTNAISAWASYWL